MGIGNFRITNRSIMNAQNETMFMYGYQEILIILSETDSTILATFEVILPIKKNSKVETAINDPGK